MAKSYVEFEVSKDVMNKTLEGVKVAKQTGKIKKGVNEVTKSIERGMASLVIIAEDVEPEEVVMHLPSLCKQKNIPYTYVESKEELGKAIGINSCSSVAIEDFGDSKSIFNEVLASLSKSSGNKEEKENKENKEKKA